MTWRRRRPLITVVAVTALVAAMQVAIVATPGALPAAAAGPVSGAIGLGGGLSGSVDERTGLFSVTVPVVSVTGPGSAGVTWSLVWDQARAAGGLDRSGFGPGWSLGVSFVDPAIPTTVYPATGGAYRSDVLSASGLQDYPQKDLLFTEKAGNSGYQIGYEDGRIDSFDDKGNLVTRSDRFGNHTQLTWLSLGSGRWAPSTIVDGYGQTTTFTYAPALAPRTVIVTAPPRSDGVPVTTTIALDEKQRVSSVVDPITDPTHPSATFNYAPVSGSSAELLTSIVSPTQATTLIAYQQPEPVDQKDLTAVRSVVTTDASGKILGPARFFSMNPSTANQRHNYTGFPVASYYQGATTDRLFKSGDQTFQYTTSLSSCVVNQLPLPTSCIGPQTSTLSTYDSKHRLVARSVSAGAVTVQTQASSYPPVQTSPVPANYARPLSTQVTYLATSSLAGVAKASTTRTTSVSRTYDDHGRVTSSTDETGTTMVTAYDGTYGLVTGETVTGKDGSRKQTTMVLSADKKVISSATTAYAAAGQPLTARVTTNYLYDTQGQPAQRTMTWAPGAKPSGDSGGPDTVVTKFASAVDTTAHTRTITTTTSAGTSAESSVQTVLDLVTELPVRTVDALGRVTSYGYDGGGRQTSLRTPDGLTTTRTYAAATAITPATYTDATPDGRTVLTTFDALGRKVRVTDNVRNQAFTTSPTTRQLSAFGYSLDGTKLTATDQLGRTVTTTLDVLGRQVQQVGATGIAHATGYDDASHTTTTTTTGAGSSTPSVTQTTGYDDGNRFVSMSRQYGDGSADPTQAKAYDGLGRVTTMSSDELTMDYSYQAPGGTSTAQTVTPQNPKSFPGDPLSLASTVALGGQQTTSERQETTSVGQPAPGQSAGKGKGQGGGQGAGQSSAAQGTRLTYDPAGRILTATDPNGRTTGYTYYADGTTATRTSPAGIVTRDTYDSASGRLTSVTAQPPGQPADTTTYTYVPAGQPGAGEVLSIAEGATTVTFSYDADRHVVSRAYSDGTKTAAAFADNGLLMSTTDVTGAVTSYGYDGLGRMTSATQTRNLTTVLASVGYTYDAFSRIATTTRRNQVSTTNTYDAHSRLATQTTTSASGAALETHAYTYDSHGNVSKRVDTVPTVSAAPTTAGAWTTAYSYDAYDRLVGSATYAGGNTAGQPTTTTTYTLNVSGDVVGAATTTRTQVGAQRQDPPSKDDKADNPHKKPNPPTGSSPAPFTSQVTNTIDPAGQLTAQTTDGTVVQQTFDSDGRLTTSLAGATMAYDGFDRMVTATSKAGATTTYAYWPDGTRRSTTTTASGVTSTQTFHYGADGTLVNDTTADATTGAGATTASYLLTAGREARTLQPGTSAAGAVPSGAPAPVLTGAGTGYLLRDRHSSVTALVDSTGAVTNSYEYTDYGATAQQDGQPAALPVVAGGRSNPFLYTGAAPTSSMTDSATGLLLLPARNYDPTQGRFTSRDSANVFNHYQAFSTNPIRLVDITGHISGGDIFLDVAMALVFIVATIATVVTGGLALPAVVETGVAAATAGEIASGVATAVGAVASATGAVTASMRAADDIDQAVKNQHFFSTKQLAQLGTVELVAGVVAVVAGVASIGVPAALSGAGADVEDAGAAAAAESDSESSSDEDVGSVFGPRDKADLLRDYDAPDPRDAWDELDHKPDYTYLTPGQDIPDDPDLRSEGDESPQVMSSITKTQEFGLFRGEESLINVDEDALSYGPQYPPSRYAQRALFGTDEVERSDGDMARSDSGLETSLKASQRSFASPSSGLVHPDLTAARGNWSAPAQGGPSQPPYSVIKLLNYDLAG